jgi:hypothetical protein
MYKTAKQEYEGCIDDRTALFVKEVRKTGAWGRMKSDHAAMHQVLSDLVSFNSFKKDTYILTKNVSDGAKSFWNNTELTHHEKNTMLGVRKGLVKVLKSEQQATVATRTVPGIPQTTSEMDPHIIGLK